MKSVVLSVVCAAVAAQQAPPPLPLSPDEAACKADYEAMMKCDEDEACRCAAMDKVIKSKCACLPCASPIAEEVPKTIPKCTNGVTTAAYNTLCDDLNKDAPKKAKCPGPDQYTFGGGGGAPPAYGVMGVDMPFGATDIQCLQAALPALLPLGLDLITKCTPPPPPPNTTNPNPTGNSTTSTNSTSPPPPTTGPGTPACEEVQCKMVTAITDNAQCECTACFGPLSYAAKGDAAKCASGHAAQCAARETTTCKSYIDSLPKTWKCINSITETLMPMQQNPKCGTAKIGEQPLDAECLAPVCGLIDTLAKESSCATWEACRMFNPFLLMAQIAGGEQCKSEVSALADVCAKATTTTSTTTTTTTTITTTTSGVATTGTVAQSAAVAGVVVSMRAMM